MENTVKTLGKQGPAVADTAIDKAQSGIREAGATLANKVDEIRGDATPGFRQAAARAQAMGKRGLDAVPMLPGAPAIRSLPHRNPSSTTPKRIPSRRWRLLPPRAHCW